MIKRTLLVESPCYLSVKNGQILFRPTGEPEKQRVIPLEDVGFIILESPQISISSRLLSMLSENGTAVIFCDLKHLPCALLQPLDAHSTHAETVRAQIAASQPLLKRLWQETVRCKINNQADLLDQLKRDGVPALRRCAASVKSGDPTNREAVAARVYWGNLIRDKTFKRDKDGEGINVLLNYGYSVLRAACARALMSSGLYCAISLHHSNRYNAFSLADDFMEPYRPFVDQIVCEQIELSLEPMLTSETKKTLLGLLVRDVYFSAGKRPLMNALSVGSASLARCFLGKSRSIEYPSLKE